MADDHRAHRRIEFLQRKIDHLQHVVATLIDAQKYHLLGEDDIAAEKNKAAQKRFIRMLKS